MTKRFLPTVLLLASLGAHAAADPSVTLHGQRFSTEFATNDDTRALGLMNRPQLAADHSMLFIFPDDQPRAFWMKKPRLPWNRSIRAARSRKSRSNRLATKRANSRSVLMIFFPDRAGKSRYRNDVIVQEV